MLTLLEEMKKRLPENLLAFQQLKSIKPTNVLQNLQPRFNPIPYLQKGGCSGRGVIYYRGAVAPAIGCELGKPGPWSGKELYKDMVIVYAVNMIYCLKMVICYV